MGDVDDETLALRSIAHRMSQGIDVQTRTFGVFQFRNVFLGKDAVEWLVADPKSGVVDIDGAIQMGQRMIESGFVIRVSRELKAQEMRHFGRQQKAKREFRGGDSFYRFDNLAISPYLLHVVVRRARNLTSHDLNGKNDPYVKLRLGRQTAVTRVQLKTNSPVWNEHFVFGVSSVEAQQLHLMVYDYDKFKHDDFIGACHIGLSHLPVEEVGDTPFESGGLEEGVVDYGDGNVGPVGAEFPSGYGRGADSETSSTAGTKEMSYGGSDANDDARSGTGTATESESGVRLVPPLGNASDSSDMDPSDWGRPASPQASVHSSKESRRRSRESSSMRASLPWVRQRGSGNSSVSVSSVARPWSGGRRSKVPLPPVHGSEEAIKFYPLDPQASECRLLGKKGDKRGSKEDTKEAAAKLPVQDLGCDIWLTSLKPKPVPVQGEAKFSLRCRIWEMSGVTNSEERNIGPINISQVIKHKAVLMLNGDRVFSDSCERNKDKRTVFNGSLVTLDTRANMVTDMLKVVVQQRIASVELVYKPVATVSIPLRNVPVIFPSNTTPPPDPEPAAKPGADAGGGPPDAVASPSDLPPDSGRNSDGSRRRRSLFGDRGRGAAADRGGSRSPVPNRRSGGSGEWRDQTAPWENLGEPRPRRYRLQTLAGPLTSKTMDNGSVMMSLMLVPSGNDLLGEQEPADSEPVSGPLPDVPDSLTFPCLDVPLKCGYQRLRKALIWHDSKLMAAFADRMDYKEPSATPWLDKEGNTGHQEDMTDCTRDRSFIIPKTSMAAATRAQANDVMLLDGPHVMSFESRVRTPEVPFGDKFEVAIRFVLVKEGPEKIRLRTSAQAFFTGQIMGLIQSQIVAAVAKVTKEDHKVLLGLIEEALSGKGAGPAGGTGRGARKGSRRYLMYIWAFVVLVASTLLSSLALHRAGLVKFSPYVLDKAGACARVVSRLPALESLHIGVERRHVSNEQLLKEDLPTEELSKERGTERCMGAGACDDTIGGDVTVHGGNQARNEYGLGDETADVTVDRDAAGGEEEEEEDRVELCDGMMVKGNDSGDIGNDGNVAGETATAVCDAGGDGLHE